MWWPGCIMSFYVVRPKISWPQILHVTANPSITQLLCSRAKAFQIWLLIPKWITWYYAMSQTVIPPDLFYVWYAFEGVQARSPLCHKSTLFSENALGAGAWLSCQVMLCMVDSALASGVIEMSTFMPKWQLIRCPNVSVANQCKITQNTTNPVACIMCSGDSNHMSVNRVQINQHWTNRIQNQKLQTRKHIHTTETYQTSKACSKEQAHSKEYMNMSFLWWVLLCSGWEGFAASNLLPFFLIFPCVFGVVTGAHIDDLYFKHLQCNHEQQLKSRCRIGCFETNTKIPPLKLEISDQQDYLNKWTNEEEADEQQQEQQQQQQQQEQHHNTRNNQITHQQANEQRLLPHFLGAGAGCRFLVGSAANMLAEKQPTILRKHNQ